MIGRGQSEQSLAAEDNARHGAYHRYLERIVRW
jgi:hypothetical protein